MPISIVVKNALEPKPNPQPAAPESQPAGSFNPRRLAARYRQACIRCGQEIPKGTMIERIDHPTKKGGAHIWVHAHCPGESGAPVEPMAPAAASDNGEALKAAQAALKLAADLAEKLEAAKKRIFDLECRTPREVVVVRPDGPKVKIEGCVNVIFDRVVKLAARRKNIFIPGPTGCGKTHLAEQVAKALGLDFSFISCSAGMSEGQVLGRLLPVGENGKFEYVPAEFVERYEKGGVFLFDELDAADSNMLLVVNSALANGKLALPNRPDNPVAHRHPDFVCIAAANTWGKGADREFCGRNQLDDATLDRFRIGSVPMDFDPAVEEILCPHDELRGRLWRYRERIMAARIKRPLSTHFMVDAYDMVANGGFTLDDVDEALFSGWRQDEVAKVKG